MPREPEEQVDAIETRQDFILFVRTLIDDFERNPGEWENTHLQTYLRAIADVVDGLPGRYMNRNEPVPKQLAWKDVAEILMAAKVYE